MADYENARKTLASMGVPPHEINRTIRESQEHENNGEEILRYTREIMGVEGYSAIWSIARALHSSFSALDGDPQREMKIKVVLATILMALQAEKANAEKENGEG